jgi:hypothetical protein
MVDSGHGYAFPPAARILRRSQPQSALPALASLRSRVAISAALVDGAVLLAPSLWLLPAWPIEWWHIIRSGEQLSAPITRLGGGFILLVLLRWRRPEAWLVFIMACMPQSWAVLRRPNSSVKSMWGSADDSGRSVPVPK